MEVFMDTKKGIFLTSLCVCSVAIGLATFFYFATALEDRKYAKARQNIRPIEVRYYPPENER